MVKNPPANAGDTRGAGSIPGFEDPLEKGMATHSSILAWKIPWTEMLGRLYSPWDNKESDMTESAKRDAKVVARAGNRINGHIS